MPSSSGYDLLARWAAAFPSRRWRGASPPRASAGTASSTTDRAAALSPPPFFFFFFFFFFFLILSLPLAAQSHIFSQEIHPSAEYCSARPRHHGARHGRQLAEEGLPRHGLEPYRRRARRRWWRRAPMSRRRPREAAKRRGPCRRHGRRRRGFPRSVWEGDDGAPCRA